MQVAVHEAKGMSRHTCSFKLALKLRNHLLSCIPLHLYMVAQLVRPLLTLPLSHDNEWQHT